MLSRKGREGQTRALTASFQSAASQTWSKYKLDGRTANKKMIHKLFKTIVLGLLTQTIGAKLESKDCGRFAQRETSQKSNLAAIAPTRDCDLLQATTPRYIAGKPHPRVRGGAIIGYVYSNVRGRRIYLHEQYCQHKNVSC